MTIKILISDVRERRIQGESTLFAEVHVACAMVVEPEQVGA